MRRCRHCQSPLPKVKDCVTAHQKNRLCNAECAFADYKANQEKVRERARKRQEQAQRKELAEYRERTKTRRDHLREAQAAFNEYIRARDEGLPCHSCGAMPGSKFGGTMDCSHYRSTGSAPHMRFNVFNAVVGCVVCNRHLSGNVVELRKGLVARWGLAKVEEIEQDQTIRKLDVAYLVRFKRIFRKRTRHIRRLRERLRKAA